MVKRVVKILKQTCLQSSVHGVKYIFLHPSIFTRCFWCVVILYLIAFASMLTVSLWMRFIALPTRKTVWNQFTPISEIAFPAVTICSPNQVKISHFKHFMRSLIDYPENVTSSDIINAVPQLVSFYYPRPVDYNDLFALEDTLTLNRYSIRHAMGELPQYCEEFLVRCFWEGQRFDCAKSFKPVFTEYGFCCSFNSKYANPKHFTGPKMTRYSGPMSALTVITNYQPHDALASTLAYGGATQVIIHNSPEFPVGDELSIVNPGTESFHSISATKSFCSDEVASLPIKSRECVFDDEYPLEHFPFYHNANCDTECIINETLASCGCVPYYYPHVRALYDTCTPVDLPCLNSIRQDYDREDAGHTCDCPKECVAREYRVRTYFGNLEAVEYVYHNMFSGLNMTKGHTVLHAFFGSQYFTILRQETIVSGVSLIYKACSWTGYGREKVKCSCHLYICSANPSAPRMHDPIASVSLMTASNIMQCLKDYYVTSLGGAFGLCLGCSVMSVLELLYLIVRLLLQHIQDARVNRLRREGGGIVKKSIRYGYDK